MKKLAILFLMFGLINTLTAYAVPDYFSTDKKTQQDPIFDNTIIIPQNYVIGVELKEAIDINKLNIADSCQVYLKNDFLYNGTLIAQEGSIVFGTITKIETTATEENKPYIYVNFTKITTPYGQDIPISAGFLNQNKNGFLYADTNGLIDTNKELDLIILQPITFIQK